MEITTLGIDLARSVFQRHGVNEDGVVVLQEKLRRGAVLDVRQAGTLPDRHGILPELALPVPGDRERHSRGVAMRCKGRGG
jgi:hypothetical protein